MQIPWSYPRTMCYSFKIKQVQLLRELPREVTNLDEPINGTAVHKGWKHAASGPEGLPNRAHAENNVQFLTDSADEVLKYLTKRKIFFNLKGGSNSENKCCLMNLSLLTSIKYVHVVNV